MVDTFRRGIASAFTGLFLFCFSGAVHAQDSSAEAVVQAIYEHEVQAVKSGARSVLADEALREKYFNTDMVERISAAAEAPEFDPILDSQDPNITNINVRMLSSAYETAEVEVTFKASGERKRLIYSLMREYGAWRVRDISSPARGWRLQELYPGP